MIKTKLQKFWNDTSGAITVEWVVIGGVVGLIAAGAIATMETGSDALVEDTDDFFERIDNTKGS